MTTKRQFFHFRYIFYAFLAFLFGIAIARKLFAGDTLAILVVVGLFVIYAICVFLCGRYKSLLIVLAFFLVGNGFYFLGTLQTSSKVYEGENFVIARITDNFREYDDGSCRVVLEDVYVNGESAKNISAYIKLNNDSKVKPGDKLAFTSTLQNTKLFDLGQFNSYYLRNDIGYTVTLKTSDIQIIGGHLNFDESLRLQVKNLLNQNMSEENAGICYAVLFGDKSGIDNETKSYYQGAGVIHVLTVSGLHVGFLIALIYFILRKLKLNRWITTAVTSIILILFNILCGFAPSVLRASLMAIIMMLAKLSGREYDSLNSLGLAGFIILLIKPLYAFDIGFLMSFSCVAAIFMLYQPIFKILKRVMPNKLAQYLAISFSAQIGVLPFLATFAESVNLLSFFANLLIVPLFSIVYPALMLCMIFVLIIPAISKVLVVFDLVFDGTTAIAKFFDSSIMKLPLFAYDIVFLIFLFLIIFLTSHFSIMTPLMKFVSASIMTLLLVFSTIINVVPPANVTSVSTINSYKTEGVLLSSQMGGSAFIYNNEINKNTIKAYLYNSKIKNMDYIILEEMPSEQDVEFWNVYNVKYFLVRGGEGTSQILNVQDNTYVQAGNFNIKNVFYNKLFVGTEINFDGNVIFVASFSLSSYNDYKILDVYLSYQNYNFVYIDGSVKYYNQGQINNIDNLYLNNYRFEFAGSTCTVRGID